MRPLTCAVLLLTMAATGPAGAQVVADQDFTWHPRVESAAWRSDDARPILIPVAVGEVPATGVVVQSAVIIEEATETRLGDDWVLCEEEAPRCDGAPIVLEAGMPHRLWLHPPADLTFAGTYDANVVIAANEDPSGRLLTFTIYGKPAGHQWLGIIILLFGVLLAALVTIWLPNRANRAQLLLPAAQLTERARGLKKDVASVVPKPGAGSQVEGLVKGLDAVGGELAPDRLEARQMIPTKWAMSVSDTAAPQYAALLDEYGTWLSAVGIVIREGMVRVAATRAGQARLAEDAANEAKAKDAAAANATDADAKAAALAAAEAARAKAKAHRAAVGAADKAIEDLADLVVPAPPAPIQPLETILSRVEEIVDALLAALPAVAAGAADFDRRQPTRVHPPGSAELLITLRRFQLIGWLAFSGLAAVVGIFVLIVQPPAFGTPHDFFFCFFWGFGLPVGAGQVAGMANVRSVFRLPA